MTDSNDQAEDIGRILDDMEAALDDVLDSHADTFRAYDRMMTLINTLRTKHLR